MYKNPQSNNKLVTVSKDIWTYKNNKYYVCAMSNLIISEYRLCECFAEMLSCLRDTSPLIVSCNEPSLAVKFAGILLKGRKATLQVIQGIS